MVEKAEEYIKESCEDGKNVIFGKIRDEEKFDDEKELILQMKKDCISVKNILQKKTIKYNNELLPRGVPVNMSFNSPKKK